MKILKSILFCFIPLENTLRLALGLFQILRIPVCVRIHTGSRRLIPRVSFLTGFILCVSFSVLCDEVYLKNGRSMEGIIKEETQDLITINVGCGEITLKRDEVDHIDKYTAGEQAELRKRWSRKYFLHPDFTPESLKGLAEDFKDLERLRKTAIDSKKEKEALTQKITKLYNELTVLNKSLAVVSEKLSKAKMEQDREGYNTLVNEFNSLAAGIQVDQYNLDNFRKQLPSFGEKISGYTSAFMFFKGKVSEVSRELEGKAKQEERYFLENISIKIEEIEKDLVEYKVDYSEYGPHIVVSALLNGTLEAKLLLDTGASLVVISKNAAKMLGIDIEKGGFPSGSTVLADGSTAQAILVTLSSVKVGNAEVKNVRTAVLEAVPDMQDGLLGMSFLENFIVSIDGKSKSLVLEEFKP